MMTICFRLYQDKTDDVDELVDGVTERVENSTENARDAVEWQEKMFDKVEELVKNNGKSFLSMTTPFFLVSHTFPFY